jgi:UDPglucose--hexose-1-phosphate uridylyltransferase
MGKSAVFAGFSVRQDARIDSHDGRSQAMTTEPKAVREIRINPIVPSESVLVATARSLRPKKAEAPAPRDTRPHVETCPFCVGNEAMTPPQIAVYPTAGPWAIRIVENLYPVLGDDRQNPNLVFGLQQTIDGYGRHEVVIDNSAHGIAVHEMGEDHLALLLRAYRSRMEQLYRSNNRLRYVLVFKNFGPAAGASIAHTHSQIIATPVIPDNVQAEVAQSRAFYQKNHRCIFCSLIDEALTYEATIYDRESGEIHRKINVGQYIIERGKKFIAIKPFASRYEWEVHILPLQHQADYLRINPDDYADLARVLRRTMARLDAVLGGAQYNFFLHSLPHDAGCEECDASYHWHLEVTPRTSIPTGFELGSGLFVNTVAPEAAAEKLRAVQLD